MSAPKDNSILLDGENKDNNSSLSTPEYLKELWQRNIIVRIRLDERDFSNFPWSPKQVNLTYIGRVPRCSYFHLCLSDCIKFLCDEFLSNNLNWELFWLEINDTPLKWQYPIGLLYDLYNSYKPKFKNSDNIELDSDLNINFDKTLLDYHLNSTWNIKLRYGNYPLDKLYRPSQFFSSLLPSENSFKSDFFMMTVKEADFIRNGSTKKVMNLSKEDQDQLWFGVVESNFDKYYSIHSQLINSNMTNMKHIPFKLYYYLINNPIGFPTVLQDIIPPFTTDLPLISSDKAPPSPSMDTTSRPTTIRDALYLIDPNLLKTSTKSNYVIITINGIQTPLDLSLEYCLKNFVFPDGFLHICYKLYQIN